MTETDNHLFVEEYVRPSFAPDTCMFLPTVQKHTNEKYIDQHKVLRGSSPQVLHKTSKNTAIQSYNEGLPDSHTTVQFEFSVAFEVDYTSLASTDQINYYRPTSMRRWTAVQNDNGLLKVWGVKIVLNYGNAGQPYCTTSVTVTTYEGAHRSTYSVTPPNGNSCFHGHEVHSLFNHYVTVYQPDAKYENTIMELTELD